MKNLINDMQGFWRSLDPNQKVSLVIATVLVVAGMVALAVWARQPQLRMLYGGLNEKDAAAIVSHLEGQGIEYEIRSGGGAIFVAEKEVYRARMDVVSSGVVSGDSVGFEIFDKNSFGASDFIQRTNLIRAIQGELARTIAQLRGVHSARVMVVMPDNRLLLVNSQIETTASVFVDVGGGMLAPSAVQSIQALVGNAVEGLQPEAVAVVDNNGNILSQNRNDDSLMAGSFAILEYRQSIENYYSNKVESMLERVVGRGNAVVRVFAEIESEQFTRMEEEFDDAGAVVRSSTTEEEVRSSIDPVRGGAATVGATEGASTGTPGRTEEETRNRKQEYEINRIVTNTSRAPGSIKRLTASVFIAAKLASASAESADAVPSDAIINRSEEELIRLREIVSNALGIDPADAASGVVTVQEMAFAGSGSSPDMMAAGQSGFNLERALNFSTEIAGSIVAFVLFLFFFQMYRKLRNQPSPFEQLKQSARSHGASDGIAVGAVTPELLNELIQQKPENAAATLKTWLDGKDDA